jgi:hypothetical protein
MTGPEQLLRVAVHEAGHCVAHLALDWPIQEVWVQPGAWRGEVLPLGVLNVLACGSKCRAYTSISR